MLLIAVDCEALFIIYYAALLQLGEYYFPTKNNDICFLFVGSLQCLKLQGRITAIIDKNYKRLSIIVVSTII